MSVRGRASADRGDRWSPDPGDFRFVGFDGLSPERACRRVELRGGEPRVAVVEHAVVSPRTDGGLPRRQRESLEAGFEPAEPDGALRELDEDAVYLGWLFNHYGHFLMQSLARAWFLSRVDPSVKVVFHQPKRSGWLLPGWAVRMLEAFGVPGERMLEVDEPTRLRRLFVPEPLFEPRSVADDRTVRAHVAMAEIYREVAAPIVGDRRPSSQPVYLSRRLLPSSQRLIVGEEDLETALARSGVRIAHPQTMTFEDQVRLINEHEDIVSNAGSAAQNVLFALHAPRLHLLTNGTSFSPDYFMHRTLVGSPTTFINCLGTGGRPAFSGAPKLTPHLLDVPMLLDYLDREGLAAGSPASTSPDDAGARLAHYEEAWLFGRVRSLAGQGGLSASLEAEATAAAAASWPVSLALARFYAEDGDERAGPMAGQFAQLAAAEGDADRIARFRSEVDALARLANRWDESARAEVAVVAAERFGIVSEAGREVEPRRRRGRGGGPASRELE